MKTPLSSILVVLFATFVGSFGAVFMKTGSRRLKGGLKYLILNPPLAAGVCFFLLSSVFYTLAIRHGELTVLYPLVALSNLWTMIWGRVFFKEPFTRGKLTGIALILAGAVCIGLGNR